MVIEQINNNENGYSQSNANPAVTTQIVIINTTTTHFPEGVSKHDLENAIKSKRVITLN